MTRLEELQLKKNAALIVVCTLGLAGVYQIQSFREIWHSNIFRGTSMSENAGIGFVLNVISFLFLTVLLVIPMFVIYFIRLIYYSIEIGRLSRVQAGRTEAAQQYHSHPMGINRENTHHHNELDPFEITYYYRENGQLYGPFTIYELVGLDMSEDTLLGINGTHDWRCAGNIGNLLDTLSLMSKLRDRRGVTNLG